MRNGVMRWRALLAGAALTTGTASAQQAVNLEAPTETRLHDAWRVQIEPILWFPSLSGDLNVKSSRSISAENLDIDEPELTPSGQIKIRTGTEPGSWWFVMSGFGFSTDGTSRTDAAFSAGGIDFDRGDRVEHDFALTSLELSVEYVLPPLLDFPEDDVRLGFNLYGGARMYHLDVTIGEPGADGAEVSEESYWFEPILGVRMLMELPKGFAIDLSVDGGYFSTGDDESWSWDLMVAFLWRFHRNGFAEIGFRHFSPHLTSGSGSDEFGFDGRLAGLWASVGFSF